MVCACSLRTQQCVDECQCQIILVRPLHFCGVVVAGCRILPSVVVSVFASLSFLLVIRLYAYG